MSLNHHRQFFYRKIIVVNVKIAEKEALNRRNILKTEKGGTLFRNRQINSLKIRK